MPALVALLGRPDTPTDGVTDYCAFLAKALAARGIQMSLARVRWMEDGWINGLRELWRESAAWRGQWVILQYTALAWSRRGFPFGAVAVLAILRRRGVRCAVFFHEPFGYEGSRWIDRIRTSCQNWIVRDLYRRAEKAIFADPFETIAWLPENETKAAYVPIGGITEPLPRSDAAQNGQKTVAIFCLSDLPNRQREIDDIFQAMNLAAANGTPLRLVFLGRGTMEATEEIEHAFKGSSVQVSNFGLCTAERISQVLSESDVMLCIRGKFFPRRSSAIAGIVCGLPIIAYAGTAEGVFAEAGIELVPYRDSIALGSTLIRTLTDRNRWQELHEKNLYVYQRYLSWKAIASNLIEALDIERLSA